MARRRKPQGHANHERWLVSYADFITLLFAFFVVMFASAQADHGKASRVSESVRKALEEGQVKAVIQEILGGTVDNKGVGNAMMRGPGGTQRAAAAKTPPAGLASSLESLRNALQAEIRQGELKLTLEERGLVISLREAAFFASGDDAIYLGAYSSIAKIAEAIRPLPNLVRLEGHTDSQPIHNSRFRNNWELSAARSIAMLQVLQSRFGIPADRMAVVGYADTVPVESNNSELGRSHNRRVDIVILNEGAARAEPRAAAGASPPPKSGQK
jgi:chemotaxis protein MotB